ncbi:putative pentatricopeptide repeat-containing protein At3g16710, mitochondrial isoform X2 [Prosopis cineraria]|uniref:putative pentatricopeptide repeat-containing protein At3g16710, mitochondrial isoform X2 n=1 Tax=Prosopis cineraria TaxID=364024 RepID=UPI00240FF38B|nr:putative pentatricopeptide repeat-containing protein At3g16710, mitochondrial isoform X2 [Prosopis cineraria]
MLRNSKLPPMAYACRIHKWSYPCACISSSSCASHIEDVPERIRNPTDSSEFKQNINFLRNKLVPENLIRVLNCTSDLNSAVKIFNWAALQKSFRHTAHTYYDMILKLGMTGNVQEMGALCQGMIKDGCPGAEEALIALIRTFVGHSRLNEAMTVFMNMALGRYKPPVHVFNVLLGALAKENGDFLNALFVYKEMVKAGILPTIETLNCLLELLLATNRVDLALDQFRRMHKKGCTPNSKTFEILVKGLFAKSRVDEATSLLEQMLELRFEPDLSFYRCSIPLFCQENKLEEAVKLFEMMKASDFAPDSFIYELLVRCLCKNLQLDSVVSLINETIESGIPLAHYVFVDTVNCFCDLGKYDEAIMFLDDKQVVETPPYNALLEGCCSAGKIKIANALLETMSEKNIADCYSWNIIVRWHCQNGDTRKAYELLGRMITSSVTLDHITYSALIIGNCRFKKYEDAMELFGQACARCWPLDFTSYSELIGGLCDVNKTEEATKVFHYMALKRCSLDPLSFYKLIKSVCNIGKVNEAIRLWQLAYYSGISCPIDVHTTMMQELFKSGRAKYLFVILSRLLVEGCNLEMEAYCILIQSMSQQNRAKEYVLLFNMMVNEDMFPDPDRLFDQLAFIANHSQLCVISGAIDKLLDGEILNSAMYSLLINGLWKEGKKHEAHRLLDLMLEKGWIPDAITHKLLIGSDVKEEQSEEMLMYNNSLQDSVSNILAESLGDA